MKPWQRLVGTSTEPRRVANPGVVFLGFGLAIAALSLGMPALSDGRTVHGVVWLVIAVVYVGWAATILRRRRGQRG